MGYCILTATYLLNRLPSKVLANKCSYELLYNTAPNLDNLRIIGCQAHVHHHSSNKFSPRSIPTILIGYPANQKGYLLYDPTTQNVLTSRHVTFNESIFPLHTTSITPSSSSTQLPNIHPTFPFPSSFSPTSPPNFSSSPSNPSDTTISTSPPLTPTSPPSPTSETHTHLSHISSSTPPPSSPSLPILPPPFPTRTSTRTKLPSTKLNNYQYKLPPSLIHTTSSTKYSPSSYLNYSNLSTSNSHFLLNLSLHTEPTTYNQAAKHPKWVEAMQKEFQALEQNQTWITTTLPPDKQPIGCKWVFRINTMQMEQLRDTKLVW